jgi:hypothetical protein
MKAPYDNNFTIYKVYPNLSGGTPIKEQRQAVVDWVNNLTTGMQSNHWLYCVKPKIRYDKRGDCYRVMVNEARVRDTGYTQLLWLKNRKNVGHIYLPPTKK